MVKQTARVHDLTPQYEHWQPAAPDDRANTNTPEESEEAHRQVYVEEAPRIKGTLTHELIAGAAFFAAMKGWEAHQRKHQRKQGKLTK